MSNYYTTGEIAKLCGVTVRTVQYYDTRNILAPSQLSEGGRRLYSEDDLKRMRIICFLRDAGISISSIEKLLCEEHPEKVISILLEQHEDEISAELEECKRKLDMIEGIKRELKSVENFSVESIGDIATIMNSKKKLRKLYATMLLTAVPVELLEIGAIVLWVSTGIWWPFVVSLVLSVFYGVWISRFYFTRVAYICPECHSVFKPRFWEALFANHTPTLRKLTCSCCGKKSWCIETYAENRDSKEKQNEGDKD
jgi:DNA-binding transcriptional MerR regulator